MTRYAPLWQQEGTYSATMDRNLIGSIWPHGGIQGGAVTLSATAMSATIASGYCAVPMAGTPGQGSELCWWDATETVTFAASNPTNPRIDTIILQVHDDALDSGGQNNFNFATVTGTASASPVAPPLPNNAFSVAQVLIPANVTNMSTSVLNPQGPGLWVPAGTLIGFTRVAPATQATVAIGGTDNALTQFNCSFTVPISGIVMAQFTCFANVGAGAYFAMQWAQGTTWLASSQAVQQPVTTAFNGRIWLSEIITGLLPNSYVTLTPHAASWNSVATNLYWGGPGTITTTANNAGAAISQVFAAA